MSGSSSAFFRLPVPSLVGYRARHIITDDDIQDIAFLRCCSCHALTTSSCSRGRQTHGPLSLPQCLPHHSPRGAARLLATSPAAAAASAVEALESAGATDLTTDSCVTATHTLRATCQVCELSLDRSSEAYSAYQDHLHDLQRCNTCNLNSSSSAPLHRTRLTGDNNISSSTPISTHASDKNRESDEGDDDVRGVRSSDGLFLRHRLSHLLALRAALPWGATDAPAAAETAAAAHGYLAVCRICSAYSPLLVLTGSYNSELDITSTAVTEGAKSSSHHGSSNDTNAVAPANIPVTETKAISNNQTAMDSKDDELNVAAPIAEVWAEFDAHVIDWDNPPPLGCGVFDLPAAHDSGKKKDNKTSSEVEKPNNKQSRDTAFGVVNERENSLLWLQSAEERARRLHFYSGGPCDSGHINDITAALGDTNSGTNISSSTSSIAEFATETLSVLLQRALARMEHFSPLCCGFLDAAPTLALALPVSFAAPALRRALLEQQEVRSARAVTVAAATGLPQYSHRDSACESANASVDSSGGGSGTCFGVGAAPMYAAAISVPRRVPTAYNHLSNRTDTHSSSSSSSSSESECAVNERAVRFGAVVIDDKLELQRCSDAGNGVNDSGSATAAMLGNNNYDNGGDWDCDLVYSQNRTNDKIVANKSAKATAQNTRDERRDRGRGGVRGYCEMETLLPPLSR